MNTTADLATFPKADIHLHAETAARVDRLLARREGRTSYDWRNWRRKLSQIPAGMERLERLDGELEVTDLDQVARERFVEWVSQAMLEVAEDGAILTEMRFGAGWVLWPDLLPKFREAERLTQIRYPWFCAEAVISGVWPGRPDGEVVFAACVDARSAGLAGIDFVPMPYEQEADRCEWNEAYAWAERASSVGLGITAHAGEFSTANVLRALQMPGMRRIGHAVHAAFDSALLDEVRTRDVMVECCLTSNIVLGAVASAEGHPIRTFVDAGIPVALCSDDPVRLTTSISGEYKLATGLGFGESDLLSFTRNGIEASFAWGERKAALLSEFDRLG